MILFYDQNYPFLPLEAMVHIVVRERMPLCNSSWAVSAPVSFFYPSSRNLNEGYSSSHRSSIVEGVDSATTEFNIDDKLSIIK